MSYSSCMSSKDELRKTIQEKRIDYHPVHVGFLFRSTSKILDSQAFHNAYNELGALTQEQYRNRNVAYEALKLEVEMYCLDSSDIYGCKEACVQDLLMRNAEILNREPEGYHIMVYNCATFNMNSKNLYVSFVGGHRLVKIAPTPVFGELYRRFATFYRVDLTHSGILYAINMFSDEPNIYLDKDLVAELPNWWLANNVRIDPSDDPEFQRQLQTFGPIENDKLKLYQYMHMYNNIKYIIPPIPDTNRKKYYIVPHNFIPKATDEEYFAKIARQQAEMDDIELFDDVVIHNTSTP